MRAYFLCNMYLSGVQCGIQSAHVVHELFTKYNRKEDPGHEALWLWAEEHKTMILLNGGYQSELQNFYDSLLRQAQLDGHNMYPYACFHEEEAALNGALTCVGIILPEPIYDAIDALRGNDPSGLEGLTNREVDLVVRLSNISLAR